MLGSQPGQKSWLSATPATTQVQQVVQAEGSQGGERAYGGLLYEPCAPLPVQRGIQGSDGFLVDLDLRAKVRHQRIVVAHQLRRYERDVRLGYVDGVLP